MEVVEDFTRCGHPARLMENNSLPGASGSRNLGASLATGEVLAFLDDDDIWSPTYLATALACLRSDDIEMVITGIRRVRSDGSSQKIVMPMAVDASRIFDRNPGLTGSNIVIRRAAFDHVGGFDPELPVMNDWDLLVRLLSQGTRYAVVDDLLVEWRDYGEDRISTPTERRARGIEAFITKHRAALSKRQYIALARQALGIRRRQSATALGRLYHTVKLLRTVGLGEAIQRRASRLIGAGKEGH
jgi:GT2 family glycosyltransferase